MNADEIRIVPGCFFIDDLPAFLQSLNDFSAKHNIKIQGFDARKIVDINHLLFSIHRARSAFENNVNEAKDIGLEVLRFSSGQRKIDKSFSMGLIQGENRSIFVFFGDSMELLENAENAFKTEFELKECADLTIEDKKPFLMKQFEIADAELAVAGDSRLKDLVMERVALVDVTR
ncbi:KEOPS complex subunit Cgi121 [Methanimicrococcus blatticola]|uniref:KEOPS complex subunit Cgi121 n=1 Tax=Methanimicrococcus blatticola TaxID=91560 RepID=A0A484F7K5_9EURY|nr:KEOPS complex subunit Cgi121 [Methanimicrococcus blatticola]MBZ3936240.1 KEOPS complex subunit Cgi121 [Methanimicrococcus blatticola]MCC2508244.1 KEOPS complex subunit Cgi121 [Methanimicrococcus blatticola]TDQ70303.1 KEOPS complex subunit Cgi121 [Methanimicrococcus blatticola]